MSMIRNFGLISMVALSGMVGACSGNAGTAELERQVAEADARTAAAEARIKAANASPGSFVGGTQNGGSADAFGQPMDDTHPANQPPAGPDNSSFTRRGLPPPVQ
jgi:hypothetical protein